MAEDEAKEEAQDGEEGAEGSEGKSKLPLIIIAAVLVLAGGGGGAFFMMGSGGGSDSEGDAAPAESASASAEGKAGDGAEASEDGAAGTDQAAAGDGGAPAEDSGDSEDSDSTQINFGETFTLKPFTINLGNPLENRFVRLEIAFEFRSGATQKKELEARLPQLRDAVISVASKKTREFLLGPDGKDQLRLEILNRVNQYLDRKIEAVYIMDILIE